MKFIENNIGKDTKVLVKAHYDRIILAPFIALGALIVLVGYLFKKESDNILQAFLEYVQSAEGAQMKLPDPGLVGIWGNVIFIIFLIAGVCFVWFKITRTTGIELAVSDRVLVGRYGTDAMCVPIEKIENVVVFKNLLGKIFNFGTITIGTPSITLKFPYIADPEKFRDKVLEMRENRINGNAPGRVK